MLLFIENLNDYCWFHKSFPVSTYLFIINNKGTRHEKNVQVRCSSAVIDDFEQAFAYIITIK